LADRAEADDGYTKDEGNPTDHKLFYPFENEKTTLKTISSIFQNY